MIYCKKCKHRGSIKEYYREGFERVPACNHSVCFSGSIEEVNYPMGRKKEDNRTRIADMKNLNCNNDCTYFEEKTGLFKKCLGKKDIKEDKPTRSKDDQILLLEAVLAVKRRELAVATGAVKNLKKEIEEKNRQLRRSEIKIAKQDAIILRMSEQVVPQKIEPKEQFIKYIDLED